MVEIQELPDHTILTVIESLCVLDVRGGDGNFLALVMARLVATGKAVDDMTVREVREIIEAARAEFITLRTARQS